MHLAASQRFLAALLIALALGTAAVAQPAPAPQPPADRLQAGLDAVARILNLIGQRAGELFGPGLGLGDSAPAAHTETRQQQERYPVGPAPSVSVFNEFGEIRIQAWEERVVEVAAQISVGAESADVAREVAQTIAVHVTHTEDRVEIRTQLPDTRGNMGLVNPVVNYTITVPAGSQLTTENFFGDTYVRGVAGSVGIEAQYGLVELAQMGGPVTVRTHGDLPVRAAGLAQGGAFHLNGAPAEFSQIAGALVVNNFRGSIRVERIDPAADLDLVSDSGPIDITFDATAEPDLTATARFGEVHTDLPVTRSALLNRTVARYARAESAQRIVCSASFADITLRREGETGVIENTAAAGDKPVNEVLTERLTAPAGGTIYLDAAPGNLRIEGVDGSEIVVVATRTVWVPSAAQASAALEALKLTVAPEATRVAIATEAAADMKVLQCSAWRMDLHVQCPRGMPIDLHADNGLTLITGMSGTVDVLQAQGAVTAEQTGGPLNLANQKGDVTVTGSAGGVKALARYGTLRCTNVQGALSSRCVQGATVIDGALGPVSVRNSGGDVRILALAGVGGEHDVVVENGMLSMLLSPEADVTLSLSASNGIVRSVLPLTGTITRDTQKFTGILKDGLHRVRLESRAGDIYLD